MQRLAIEAVVYDYAALVGARALIQDLGADVVDRQKRELAPVVLQGSALGLAHGEHPASARTQVEGEANRAQRLPVAAEPRVAQYRGSAARGRSHSAPSHEASRARERRQGSESPNERSADGAEGEAKPTD